MWERACPRRRCISNNQAASPTAIAGKPAPTLTVRPRKIPHPPQSKCGSGLAREGGVSVTTKPPDPPPSQASQLPHLLCDCAKFHTHRNPNVGAGLPAKAVYLHQPSRLTHRCRSQASSHLNERQTKISAPTAIQMWERACPRRRCISNNQAASPTAIAGKPAPTLMSGRPKSPHPAQSKGGSGLAREGGVSAPTKPPDPPPSQASQLPH